MVIVFVGNKNQDILVLDLFGIDYPGG